MIKHPGLSLLDASIRNAKELIQNAILLQNRNCFGHGYALCVLAFEEFGKAIAGYYWFLGIFEENDLHELKIFSDHVNKQILALNILGTLVFVEYYDNIETGSEMLLWIDSFQKGELDGAKLERRIVDSARLKNTIETNNLIEIHKSIKKFEQKPSWLDQKKQSGFYVNMNKRVKLILGFGIN